MANSVGGMLQTHPPSLPCVGVRALGCASLWMGAVLEELVPCNRGACCRQTSAAASEEALRQRYRHLPSRGDSEHKRVKSKA